MPQSDHWAIPWVLNLLGAIAPKSVLDVGVGNGQYGMLVRQNLDISHGRLTPSQWTTRIDGVEVFEQYRNPIWDYFYNTIHISEALKFCAGTDFQYDAVLVCDVIEHFQREEAIELIRVLRSKSQTLVITTPYGAYPQGSVFGNEAERHLSEWWPRDFKKLGATTVRAEGTFMAVFSEVQSVHEVAQGLPALFHYTARELATFCWNWPPRMMRSRLRRLRAGRTAPIDAGIQ